jgi:hypothetical protein
LQTRQALIFPQIRTAYAPKTAEYLIRNLHKPLDLEMLKRACEMMRGKGDLANEQTHKPCGHSKHFI